MKRSHIIFFIISVLIFSFSAGEVFSSELRVLYVNDFHGFAEPYATAGSNELVGGAANLAAAVDRFRGGKPSLLLAAGDMIQGNSWANLTRGASVIALMNLMRFDAMVVGNHEFDFGAEALKKRAAEARFPILGANVKGLAFLKRYTIRDIGGVKVAVIGVVTDDTPILTNPGNVEGIGFTPPAAAVKECLGELMGKADIFIVLSHIGYPADRVLASEVKGIDLIVGGHSHTRLSTPVVVGSTIIVQAWEHAKALGVLDLDVEEGKIVKFSGRLEEVRPEPGKSDEAAERLVKAYREREGNTLDETIGEALVDLDGEHVRVRETDLGDLIADIVRQRTGADATIINGGGIRASLNKGPIKIRDIYSALPFEDSLAVVRLSGDQIRRALEHGVSAIEEGSGRFPQISGLSFAYSPLAQAGKRVKDILVGNSPIEPEEEYIVATNDFLAAGGDGYKVFKEALERTEHCPQAGNEAKGSGAVIGISRINLRDAVIEYIKEKKRIAPGEMVRIRTIP